MCRHRRRPSPKFPAIGRLDVRRAICALWDGDSPVCGGVRGKLYIGAHRADGRRIGACCPWAADTFLFDPISGDAHLACL